MITKYDIGDRVIVKQAWFGGDNSKIHWNVMGTIKSITITKENGNEYNIQLYYPEGTVLYGKDVSGHEVINYFTFKENDILQKIILSDEEANERDWLIFDGPYNPSKYLGGVRYFDHLEVQKAWILIQKGYLNRMECQNNSPTAEDMLHFCEQSTGSWTLHGYAVVKDRSDCRISIEGIDGVGPFSVDTIIAFSERFRDADEFHIDTESAHCWYD